MEKIIHFDFCALLLLIFLLVLIIIRKMTTGTSNIVFLTLFGANLAAAVFDIWAITLDKSGSMNNAALYTAHSGYLFFHSLTTPLYVIYIMSLAGTLHRLQKNLAAELLVAVPISAVAVMLIINPFTGQLFTFENHIYTRSEHFYIFYISAAYYMIMTLVYIFKYRKLLSDFKVVSLSSLVPLTIAAVSIQFINPNYVVEMFASALSLLVITMTAQRPEELIDARTQLGSHLAYIDVIENGHATEKKLTLIMLNIENYLSIQTVLPHSSTAELLRKIGVEITKVCRLQKNHASVYYLDRGRFRVVLTEKYACKALDTANMMNNVLKNNFDINDLSIEILPHICIVTVPDDIGDLPTLASFGNNFHEGSYASEQVVMASDLLKNKSFDMSNNIDLIIEKAIKNDSFKIYYQPIYSVEKKRFVSAEALLRLIDDEYGFVPPNVFIPAAEKSGAIHKIGDFVLNEVCRFIASDKFKNLGLDYIEINLSVAQCMHGDLADKVLETLKKYNISSDKINLEITETVVSHTHNVFHSNLAKLDKAGISFSLDDYGTGYSNMRRVVQLPLKIVKLDKSFVDEQNNPKMWIVLQNTVKTLKDMDMEIVVEGIETKKMVEQFSNLNCDYIQGYYYSQPIPEDKFIEFIKNAKSA